VKKSDYEIAERVVTMLLKDMRLVDVLPYFPPDANSEDRDRVMDLIETSHIKLNWRKRA